MRATSVFPFHVGRTVHAGHAAGKSPHVCSAGSLSKLHCAPEGRCGLASQPLLWPEVQSAADSGPRLPSGSQGQAWWGSPVDFAPLLCVSKTLGLPHALSTELCSWEWDPNSAPIAARGVPVAVVAASSHPTPTPAPPPRGQGGCLGGTRVLRLSPLDLHQRHSLLPTFQKGLSMHDPHICMSTFWVLAIISFLWSQNKSSPGSTPDSTGVVCPSPACMGG